MMTSTEANEKILTLEFLESILPLIPGAIDVCKAFIEKEGKDTVDPEFLAQYIELWPNRKEIGLDYIICDEALCKKKLTQFLPHFSKFTGLKNVSKADKKSLILKATYAYIKKFRDRNSWEYFMKAENFIIHRDKGSELARRIKEGVNTIQRPLYSDLITAK